MACVHIECGAEHFSRMAFGRANFWNEFSIRKIIILESYSTEKALWVSKTITMVHTKHIKNRGKNAVFFKSNHMIVSLHFIITLHCTRHANAVYLHCVLFTRPISCRHYCEIEVKRLFSQVHRIPKRRYKVAELQVLDVMLYIDFYLSDSFEFRLSGQNFSKGKQICRSTISW